MADSSGSQDWPSVAVYFDQVKCCVVWMSQPDMLPDDALSPPLSPAESLPEESQAAELGLISGGLLQSEVELADVQMDGADAAATAAPEQSLPEVQMDEADVAATAGTIYTVMGEIPYSEARFWSTSE